MLQEYNLTDGRWLNRAPPNAEHSGKHLGWFVGNSYLCYDDWQGNKPAAKEPNNLKIPVITRLDYLSIADRVCSLV